nr:beta-propeller fold lactonase family protein [Novosphingobium flavum]
MTRYEVDVEAATLTFGETITLPSSIQYAWPLPAKRALYAVTSDAVGGSRTITGQVHRLCALRFGPRGKLVPLGQGEVLRQRPIHMTIDRTGSHVLVAYNVEPEITVHPLRPNGAIAARLPQPQGLDYGIFPHQVRAVPGNRSVVLVTRGNNAGGGRPEDPGALKLFHYDSGRLSNLTSIAVGGKGGYGYGPRHLDFHPVKPWVYLSIERQNELHMHRIVDGSFAPVPDFIRKTTEQAERGVAQVAGAIHVHPKGHVVYVSNRASGTRKVNGQDVWVGGDNTISVFAIDQTTGEPTLVQQADPKGFHVRTFAIDPSGRLLVAATMVDMVVRDPDGLRKVSAGLSLFRIAPDGKLDFVRKYDVTLPEGAQQLWVNMVEVDA